MNILLVEDNDLIRDSTAAIMRDLGHAVMEAGSAESGMAILRRSSIDVLFTDVGLPGGSGDVLAAEARMLHPSIGVVFATGLGHIPDPCADDTRMALLRKPYDVESIAAALAAVSA